MLDHLTPDTVVPASLYERIDALDAWLWQERASVVTETFIMPTAGVCAYPRERLRTC
jgi:hypothetical protein